VASVLKIVKGSQAVGNVIEEPGAWFGETEIT
jgi:hypothetical protein